MELEEEKARRFSMAVTKEFQKRLKDHLFVIKCLEKSRVSKKDWIKDALREKIAIDGLEIPEDLVKELRINFDVEPELGKEIESRVDLIRRLRGNYSKKQWIQSAINEKLDREEQVKKLELLKLEADHLEKKKTLV